MKKIGAFIAIAGGLSLMATSCKTQPKIQVTEDGLMYRIVKDEPGDVHPQYGDLIELHASVKVRDSVLTSSYKSQGGQPYQFIFQEAPNKSDFTNGFKLMTPGDSAIFYVPFDTLKKYQQGQFPGWIKDNDTFVYEIKLVSVKNKDEMQKEMMEQMRKADSVAKIQIEVDDKLLQDYFAKNNLTPKKTASGLYYIIEKEGKGDLIQPGQMASTMYTGRLLDGKAFDSNVDPAFGHTDPFMVPVGAQQVIKGWDEGLMLLKKGSKARFFIPSPLAYGQDAMGDRIPANSVLIFDVEILDVTSRPTN